MSANSQREEKDRVKDSQISLPPEYVKTLDQLRTRLSQLSTSIQALQRHLSEDPIPSWPTLQSDASTLGANLNELATILNDQRQLFTSMHAYPLSTFPGVSQEMILHGLLRKRLEPKAEAWIDESLRLEDIPNTGSISVKEIKDHWDWAGDASREFFRQLLENGDLESDYTLAEQKRGIKNVFTGIKSVDDDPDKDEDGDQEMRDGEDRQSSTATLAKLAAAPLEGLLRFTSGGQVAPPQSNR